MFKSGIGVALKRGNTCIKTLFIFSCWCTICVTPVVCATVDTNAYSTSYTTRSSSLEGAIANLDNTYILSKNYTVYDSLPYLGSKKRGNIFSISTKNDTIYTIKASDSSLDGFYIRNNETLNLTNIQLTNFQTSIKNDGIVNAQKSIMSDIVNTGDLTLTDSIGNKIINSGTLSIDNSGINNLENDGYVKIVSVPLFMNNISGTGHLNIEGNNRTVTEINLKVPITQQNMTIQPNVNVVTDFNMLHINNLINNLGQLTIDVDGTNNNTIMGTGTLNIESNVSNNAYIDQGDISTYYNTTFTNTDSGVINVQNISGQGILQNDGSLNIFGTVDTDITGSGVLTMDGTRQQINSDIHQSVININDNVINNGNMVTDTLTGSGVLINNGVFDVHDSSNVAINGNGTMRVFDGVVLSNNITQDKIIFNPDNVQNFKTIINISDISANSSNYTGSRITAKELEINDAELQILLSEHPDLELGEQTDWLHIFDLDENGSVTGNWTNVITNNRYSISPDSVTAGNFKIQYNQSAANVAESVGADTEHAMIADLWDNIDTTNLSTSASDIANRLYLLSQSGSAEYNQVLSAITPNTSTIPANIPKRVNNIIFDNVSNHLLLAKNNYGYVRPRKHISIWAQGLYNNSQQNDSDNFSADTFGISVGGDIELYSNARLGLGYAHTSTDGDNNIYDMSSDGNILFTYGEYQLNNWRFDGMLSYNFSNINQQTYLVSDNYDTQSIGMNLLAEYQINPNFGGFGGTRYFTTFQHEYTDSIGQQIDTDTQTSLSLNTGIKYAKYFRVSRFNVKPTVKLGVLYDIFSAENNIDVNIANINYQLSSEDINPLGINLDLQLESAIKSWRFILGYDCELYDGLANNSGTITVKYQF